MNNRLLELFNWKISRFLAIGYIRFINLLSIFGVILGMGFEEWSIARSTTNTMGFKIALGIVIPLGALAYLLLIRVILEFFIAIFYIESHLRTSTGRVDDGDIS